MAVSEGLILLARAGRLNVASGKAANSAARNRSRRVEQLSRAKPVESFAAWSTDDDGQYVAWNGRLMLGAQFYETLIAHAVPLDSNAIAKLKNSSLGLDVYAWLAHRLCRVRSRQGVRLSWTNLQEQFGSEYGSTKDFKKRFLQALRKAVEVYPAARIDQVRGGLMLHASPPPIAHKAVVVALPAKQTARKPAALPRPYVSEDALDELRTVAPGWDRQFLLAKYMDWIADKEQPRDIDRAFIGWVKSFTKGKPPA
jgi:hypothetical protein